MAFVDPKYSKRQVNKAGDILASPESYSVSEQQWADDVLTNWRACHAKTERLLSVQTVTLAGHCSFDPSNETVAAILVRGATNVFQLSN